jgi:hypothetical protein
MLRLAAWIGMLILIASCAGVVFERFSSTKWAPQPLADWVYHEVVRANKEIAWSFVLVEDLQ